uniref:Uncharacterized protein n=1 Tax=Arundo donax TaxID=35708 RepID=A0A0A8XZ67_ARUDO
MGEKTRCRGAGREGESGRKG